MKINITPQHFLEITKRGYSLDQIFLLRCINDNIDLSSIYEESVKIDIMRATLERKGLLTEEGKITTIGQELLLFMETKIAGKIIRKKVDDSLFSQFWENYPKTDTLVFPNKKFSGCRTLRQNESACRLKFDEYILNGIYTGEQMVEALKYDVANKKEMSLKTNTNKLTYMQNSLTYLNQKSFDAYIGLNETTSKEEDIIPEETKNLFG